MKLNLIPILTLISTPLTLLTLLTLLILPSDVAPCPREPENSMWRETLGEPIEEVRNHVVKFDTKLSQLLAMYIRCCRGTILTLGKHCRRSDRRRTLQQMRSMQVATLSTNSFLIRPSLITSDPMTYQTDRLHTIREILITHTLHRHVILSFARQRCRPTARQKPQRLHDVNAICRLATEYIG